MNQNSGYRVAVVQWSLDDTIAEVISDELEDLGHHVVLIAPAPQKLDDFDIVFSYGPYGNFLTIPTELAALPAGRRPIFVHWNTEGLPDLRIPWPIMQAVGAGRSWLGRLAASSHSVSRWVANIPPMSWFNNRLYRFRYLGDYYYAHHKGWLDVFADSSVIYGKLHSQHGLPTLFVPWGATSRWYANLNLERDIDVLWMGNREGRRHNLLDRIGKELRDYGLNVHIADGIANPFVHGEARTRMLNRAKITLNLTRTTYDDNFSRFSLAAPNHSLIVSETVLPHCPVYEPGVHYVSTPVEQIAKTILYYLNNDEARRQIVEQAYQLVTTELVFRNSIKTVLDAVDALEQPIQKTPITTGDQLHHSSVRPASAIVKPD